MDIPEVQYATAEDGLAIAYQDFGSGEPVVFVNGLVSNVEMAWEHEVFRRAMIHCADHCRMILFDKRGMGCSDRWDEPPTLDTRIRDIVAVFEAVGLDHALVGGISEGGLMAAQFAARHPGRVDRLVLANALCGSDRIGEYGDGLAPRIDFLDRLPVGWGRDPQQFVDGFVPSQAGNQDFLRWVTRFQRQSAGRSDIRRQIESLYNLGSPDYSAITAPTLVLACNGDWLVPPEISQRTAALVPGAHYVELDNPDHYYYAGVEWREPVDALLEFLLDRPIRSAGQRQFATVLFTDVVGSTTRSADAGDAAWSETIATHNRIVRGIVEDLDGSYVKSTGDGFLAHFPTPSSAIDAAIRIRSALEAVGLPIRAGVHTGEILVHEDGDISGLAVNFAARVEQHADDGAIWVSSTVRDLLRGSDHRFEPRGEHELKGIEGTWALLALV